MLTRAKRDFKLFYRTVNIMSTIVVCSAINFVWYIIFFLDAEAHIYYDTAVWNRMN